MNKIKMEENDEINKGNKNKNERKINENIVNKNIAISSSNIHLDFINEDKKINNMKYETVTKNNKKENKTLFDEEEIHYNNIQKREKEKNEEKEQQLLFLYYKYLSSFEKKKYENIIYELENLKISYDYNSPTFFKIQILKLRSLLKMIKQQYFKLIILKDQEINLIEIMKKITKFKNECEILSDHLNPYNINFYEDIIQVYSKFLFYLAFLYKIKEEFIKSMSYITMGVNLMKIFFIRRKVAEDIKTYILYCQLLLMLINNLIGDYNYKTATFYCQVLFKVINVAYKIVIKKKLAKKYYFKLFQYLGFNYLFIGLCLEQNEDSRHNNENCYYAYKQAYYFLSLEDETIKTAKTIFPSFFMQNNDNIASLLTQFIMEKFKDMFDKEKTIDKTKIKRYKVIQIKNEKTIELEKIENMRNDRYIPIEENIYNNILTQNTQNHIEKLDNELISVIYKTTEEKKKKQKTLSQKNKNFLYNFDLFKILLSKKFRNYIIKTNKFQFNNPLVEKQSTDSLRRYLNKNIKIKDNSYIKSNINNKRSSIKLNDNSLERKKLNIKFLEKINLNNKQKIKLDKNIFKRYSFKNRALSSHNIFQVKSNEKPRRKRSQFIERNEPINLFKSLDPNYNKSKKFIFRRNSSSNNLFLLKKFRSEFDALEEFKEKKKLNKEKCEYYKLIKQNRKESLLNNNFKNYQKVKNINNIISRNQMKYKSSRYTKSYSFLENDFERKYLDKNFLSPRYFKKVSFLDSFFVKELSFQKKILKLKENSSKTFFDAYEKDFYLNLSNYNNIYAINNIKKKIKESAYKTYLRLNDKAIEEAKKIRSEDNSNKNRTINLLDYPKNMHKIFKKYIQISKDNKAQKSSIYSKYSKNVKKINESKLLNLDSGLKELNYIISYKNKQLKNFSFSNRLKIIN